MQKALDSQGEGGTSEHVDPKADKVVKKKHCQCCESLRVRTSKKGFKPWDLQNHLKSSVMVEGVRPCTYYEGVNPINLDRRYMLKF